MRSACGSSSQERNDLWGGLEVDLVWKDGKLLTSTIKNTGKDAVSRSVVCAGRKQEIKLRGIEKPQLVITALSSKKHRSLCGVFCRELALRRRRRHFFSSPQPGDGLGHDGVQFAA